jgi:carnitine O-acetyltransferase
MNVDLAGAKIIKFGIESKWSSKVSSTHKFRLAIVEAMRDMRKICEHGQETSPSSTDATRNKL